jgi:tetratricopeptide (TPR) repeat protein
MAAVFFKKRILAAPKQANVNDYYFLGLAQYNNKQYAAADSSFSVITKNNPELPIGYQWRARANSQLDSTQALSKPFYEQYIQKVGTDTIKNKDGLIEAYSQLGYYYLLLKDKTNASIYYRKILNLDPANQNAHDYFESLKPKPVPKTQGKK